MEALHDVVRAGKARYIGASQHVRLAVREGADGGRAARLDAVRLDAEPLQPRLPRGGAGDDPAVRRPGDRRASLEPARARVPRRHAHARAASAARRAPRRTPSPKSCTAARRTSTSSTAWPRSPPSAACRPRRSRLPGSSTSPAVTAPIVGATKLEHLEDALAAAELTLSAEEIARLEEPYRPHPVLGHAD